jgi:hypothetical protein
MDEINATPLPGLEGALNVLEEAQLKSLHARQIFEAQGEAEPWMDDYWDLIGKGWSWRQAVYLLWAAQPKDLRQPATQAELATQVLGLASDRVIRDWKSDERFMAETARLVGSIVLKHRADVLHALAEVAQSRNPRAHADRKMFLEMTGDYVAKQAIGLGVSSGVADLDDATLAAMAAIPGRSPVAIAEPVEQDNG